MLNLITQRSVVQIHPPQPTPSISYGLSVQVLPLTLCSQLPKLPAIAQQPTHLQPVLFAHSLRVQVQGGADVRVP